DNQEQHEPKRMQAEATVRTEHDVEVDPALQRRRQLRAFPTRRHVDKGTPISATDNTHVAKRLTRAKAEQLYARLAAGRPEPKTELEYVNPYTLLVAVVLSAQATDAGVNRATKDLFQTVDTPEKMLRLGEAALRKRIQTIGLWRNKAKNIIALSKQLIEN